MRVLTGNPKSLFLESKFACAVHVKDTNEIEAKVTRSANEVRPVMCWD